MNHVSYIVPPKASTMLEQNMPQNAVCYFSTFKLLNVPTLKFHPDCGNSLAAGAGRALASECSMKCPGNATEFCGKSNGLIGFIVLKSFYTGLTR